MATTREQLIETVEEMLQPNAQGKIDNETLQELFKMFLQYSVDSSYEVWKEANPTGSKEDFLAFLSPALNQAVIATEQAGIAITKAAEANTSAIAAAADASELANIIPTLITKSNVGRVITSNNTNPTELPDFKFQKAVFVDTDGKEYFWEARSTFGMPYWVVDYSPNSFNRDIAPYLPKDSQQIIITSNNVSPTEVPSHRDQAAVFVDTDGKEYRWRARSKTFMPYWELSYNVNAFNRDAAVFLRKDNLAVVLTSNNVSPTELPIDKGVVGVFVDTDGKEYYWKSRSKLGMPYWIVDYTPNSFNRDIAPYLPKDSQQIIITSNNVSPTEVPSHRDQAAVFVDTDGKEYRWRARSKTFMPYWELSYNVNAFNRDAAVFLRKDNLAVVLTSNNVSPTELPIDKGVVGVFVDTDGKEYYWKSRSKLGMPYWIVDYTPNSFNRDIAPYLPKDSQQIIITSNNVSPTEVPSHRDQAAVFVDTDGKEYRWRARSKTFMPYWELSYNVNAFNRDAAVFLRKDNLAVVLTSNNVSPTELPIDKGVVGVFVDTDGKEYYWKSRSKLGMPYWIVDYTPNSFNRDIAPYLPKDSQQIIITSNNVSPTEVPSHKDQAAVFVDTDGKEYRWRARSKTFMPYWELSYNVNAFNRDIAEQGISSAILDNQQIISAYETEQYAHSAYPEFFGDWGYVVYMANDVGNYEGADGQMIRMSKFHIINPTLTRTVMEVARGGQTYGITLDNHALQVPNLLKIDESTLRIFFRATIGGVNVICYKDFNVDTQSLGNAFVVNCKIKAENTVLPLNQTNAYAHYDYLRGMTDSLGGAYKDFFVTSDIKKLSDGKWWSGCSLGSGLNKETTTILMSSDDNGATWTLYASPDPYTQPGVIGLDTQYFWEASISEDANNIYMFGRGGYTGPAKGVWMVTIPKTNLYTMILNTGGTSVFTKVWEYSGQKPCTFYYPSIGNVLITESQNKLGGTLGSLRTSFDVILISSNFTTFKKKFTMQDANGAHTASVVVKADTAYISFSTSKRRIPQNRSGSLQYHNTTEIAILELKRNYFL